MRLPRRPGAALGRRKGGFGREMLRPAAILLITGMILGTLVPVLIADNVGSPALGTIIGPQGQEPAAPASNDTSNDASNNGNATQDTMASESNDTTPIALSDPSSNMTMSDENGSIVVRTEGYKLVVANDNGFVDYTIHPYFSDDVIRYRRVNPLTPGEGTVDKDGNALDSVHMSVSAHGIDGNKVWFLESCPQFSLNQSFTLYKDYLELNVTYVPGTTDVLTTYFVGMYHSDGSLIKMFDTNGSHRYVPGYPEDTPSTNGIGGWYPSYEMFAPAFDMRDPKSDLGLEWGYNDTEAYVYSPIWMKDMGSGAENVFALKYSSKNSVVPNIGLGTQETFHTFIRPYQYSGNGTQGHDAGYAKWVAPQIAAYWGHHGTQIFPLTVNNLGGWDATMKAWVESSNVTVATYSTNPDQINWNYKSTQLMDPATAQMPSGWGLLDSSGQVMLSQTGYPVASVADPDYRNYLINQDSDNAWWWSTSGVFLDEVNVINGKNELRNDYSQRADFVYDGYLKLVQETYASGEWNYVITNPCTGLLHLAIVSDLSMIEGYEAVSMYNVDFKAHVVSTMDFVNNIPADLRPRIDVDQNYDPAKDMGAVYSVLFGSARYGFEPNLKAYSSGASQLPALNMAQDMFVAMGADRHHDRQIAVGTLDMSCEGTSLTTDRQMAVVTGNGDPTVTFTKGYSEYMLTNLWGSSKNVTIVMPSDGYYVAGDGIKQVGPLTYTADGKAIFHGTVEAGKTGYVVKTATASIVPGSGSMDVSSVSQSAGMVSVTIASGSGPATAVLANVQCGSKVTADVNGQVQTSIADGNGTASFSITVVPGDVIVLRDSGA